MTPAAPWGHSLGVRRGALLILIAAGAAWLLAAASGCGTVDPGDNFIAPDVMIDDEFFFCAIQPQVVTVHRCASGGAGEAGSCHSARSALRLDPAAEGAAAPACTPAPDYRLTAGAVVPPEYMTNFDRVQFTVQSDPLTCPFYRRPLAIDSHPRQIFGTESAEAQLIIDWISRGGM